MIKVNYWLMLLQLFLWLLPVIFCLLLYQVMDCCVPLLRLFYHIKEPLRQSCSRRKCALSYSITMHQKRKPIVSSIPPPVCLWMPRLPGTYLCITSLWYSMLLTIVIMLCSCSLCICKLLCNQCNQLSKSECEIKSTIPQRFYDIYECMWTFVLSRFKFLPATSSSRYEAILWLHPDIWSFRKVWGRWMRSSPPLWNNPLPLWRGFIQYKPN